MGKKKAQVVDKQQKIMLPTTFHYAISAATLCYSQKGNETRNTKELPLNVLSVIELKLKKAAAAATAF